MSINTLPFTEPGAYEPQALNNFYQELHAAPESTFYDEGTDAFVVWRHVDVAKILGGENPAVSNTNTLDPLDSKLSLATNPRTWKGLAQLTLHTTPATANAPQLTHADVKATVYDRESNVSLNRSHFVRNYGELVLRQVAETTHSLEETLRHQAVADFSHDYVRPLASQVIGEILGFSRSEQELVQRWSDAQSSLLGRHLGRAEQGFAISGLANLAVACHGLIKARREDPKTDLASLLASEKHQLSDKVAASTAMNLIAAGYATTYGTLQNSLRYLLTEGHEHWEQLDDPEYAKKVVPELIRLETGLVGWKRYADKNVRLDSGEIIPGGSQILTLLGAANRDPVFADPNAVILDRPNTPRQLSFGRGRHLCMGRELAILEITAALVALRTTIPSLRVEENAGWPIAYEPDNLFRTIRSLPISAE